MSPGPRRGEPWSTWAVLLLYVGLIFFLSSRGRTDPFEPFPYWDKVVHFAEYGILGLIGMRAVRLSWPPRSRGGRILQIAAVLACAIGIAIGDELFQASVPGRVSSWYDFLADTVGLAGGTAFSAWQRPPAGGG